MSKNKIDLMTHPSQVPLPPKQYYKPCDCDLYGRYSKRCAGSPVYGVPTRLGQGASMRGVLPLALNSVAAEPTQLNFPVRY